MKTSNLPLGSVVTIFFISCLCGFLGQSRPALSVDGVTMPQFVSYSPMDAIPSASGSMARTKKIKMACYPVGGGCTKNSDCCTGFCRTGLSRTYCDNP